MNQIRRILVATDYSEHARRTETRAAMLSVELKADTLEMMAIQATRKGLHEVATANGNSVLGQDTLFKLTDRAYTEPNAGPLPARPKCIHSIRIGKPSEAIAARADELRADLTVVPAPETNPLSRLFTGDSTDEVVRACNRPLLLVKKEPKDGYKKVLVAVDFSNESREAARTALLISPSAHVTFLHAFHVPDEGAMREVGISEYVIQSYRVRASETARGELNQFISDLGPKKQLVTRAVHHGYPAPIIYHHAMRMEADLIALGKHGKSSIQEHLLGSVTRRLMSQAPCDLLIAPGSNEDLWTEPPAA